MLNDKLPELKGIISHTDFTSIKEINQLSIELTDDARLIHSKAKNVVNKSSDGLEMTTNVIDSMEKIETQSKVTEENITNLIMRLREIQQINQFITNVSTQTQLLSINASILAAKAGEFGKGFQILAEQIKKLAEESKGSANEIEDLLSHIDQDKTKVTESMRHMKENIKIGSRAYTGAIDIFTDINQSASANLGLSQGIVDKSIKQASTIEKLK